MRISAVDISHPREANSSLDGIEPAPCVIGGHLTMLHRIGVRFLVEREQDAVTTHSPWRPGSARRTQRADVAAQMRREQSGSALSVITRQGGHCRGATHHALREAG